MARLIDADALKDYYGKWSNKHTEFLKPEIDKYIDDQPTVDAVPVVYGRWEYVPKTKDAKSGYCCSVCHGPIWHAPDVPRAFDYCPSCGAYMR